MNTQMGESLLKNIGPEEDDMEIEAEWDKPTKRMITQEETDTERELGEI